MKIYILGNNMFKKIFIYLSISILALTSIAQSQESINPWKHCGIGAMVWGDKETGAIISNILWDLGTTAVSSKVSSADTCKGAPAQTAMFINESYDKLAEETAAGSGDHLTAMMDLMQCESNSQSDFIKAVRADFAESISKPKAASLTRTEKAEQYFYIVDKHFKTDFSKKCTAI